jgi:methyltransferase (TIGR00027 family)
MNSSIACSRRLFLRGSVAAGIGAIAASLRLNAAWAQTRASAARRMETGEPSATARGAALSRAVHQIVDYPRVLEDPHAIPILGPLQQGELQQAVDRRSRALRASIVMRSRYAEDRLAAAVTRGVRQYVVLGAGLDTFAYRNPHARLGLRVFEVDHPATQRFKRQRLGNARITVPPETTFVPIDFETQTLSEALANAGFRFEQPAFFSMLGVVIYLTDDAFMQTLNVIAACASATEIVFSFSVPDDLLTDTQQTGRARSMAQLAALGEPWISFYEPSTLAERLRARGFSAAEVFAPQDANRTYFAGRIDGLRVGTEHMMSAYV